LFHFLTISLKFLKIQVFIHKPEDTVWMSFAVFPYPITSFFLQAKPDDGMKAADLHIEQVDTIQADKTSHPCQYDIR